MYGYEWADEYGIFRLTINAKIQKEIRPVFHEELDFFGMDKYWKYPKNINAPLLWAEGVRRYVLNGECIAEAFGGNFYTKPKIKILKQGRISLKPVDVNRLFEVNRQHIIALEQKAIAFIRQQFAQYSKQDYAFICAFSGGKDSLALLSLVSKALAPSNFWVVFSNTGMELSDTLKAVERAKKLWPQLRFEEAQSHMSPSESWNEFGPPGRRMRWCCAVHKSVPTILKLREITKNYNAKAVVFDGVRAEESSRRAKYDKVSIGAKNISQINCHAIIEWNTAELYCYLLSHNLLLNDAYRIGLFRVGCMVCPLASEWWEGIANTFYKAEMKQLVAKVERFAKRAKQSDPKKYVENGGWKARLGGKGLDNGGNRTKEIIKNNSLVITITKPKQDWAAVARILGVFVEQSNKMLIQKIGTQPYECRLHHDKDTLTVSYYPFSQMNRFVISHLRGVANKVAYCVGCKACVVQCPTGAFTIQPNRKIVIRENLCTHCCNCLEFTERSCIVANNMRVPEGGFINMKGLDPYHHFGFRQAWLTHFVENKLDCFTKGTTLGTVQYSALKTWLKDAEITEMVKVGKTNTISITSLGDKLIKIGPYNPFTWAIIWANLCYNSTICRWYCLNAELGATYEKADLVVMLGESYSKSNRENAITALTETLRLSPIGSALKQGLPIELTKNTYAYMREGWNYPDAAALLYALYLYAEHTGQKTFTFTELANAHANPEAKGISPHDIFGIDVKDFREKIQGLAMTFSKYIRVSFVANLDNIILENYKSNDIVMLAENE